MKKRDKGRGVRLDECRIRGALRHSGASPEEVAARAGISGSTLRRALSGRGLNRLTARAIAKALRVRLEEIELKPAEVAA
jgi:lambda repressor-like predicted transcriptional regulator